MAFCRAIKMAGLRVVFADGHAMAECRMYRTAREVWTGFSKNIYLGVGARPWRLALALFMYLTAFALPFASVAQPLGIEPEYALTGSVAAMSVFAMVTFRHRYPATTVLLLPLGVLAFVAIGLNSFRWHLTGRIRWRDRVYGSALSSQEITP